MTKLVLSVSGAFQRLLEGTVKLGDLKDALFCPGCSYEALDAYDEDGDHDIVSCKMAVFEFQGKDSWIVRETFQGLKAAVRHALDCGRCCFIKDGTRSPDDDERWAILTSLLIDNGYPSLFSNYDGDEHGYTYPSVRDALEHQGFDLEVVF